MALDQAYDQMNETIKGDGGVIGITDNPLARNTKEVVDTKSVHNVHNIKM